MQFGLDSHGIKNVSTLRNSQILPAAEILKVNLIAGINHRGCRGVTESFFSLIRRPVQPYSATLFVDFLGRRVLLSRCH